MDTVPPELVELVCAYLPEWDFRSLFQVTQVSAHFPILRDLFDTQSFWMNRARIQYNITPENWHRRWLLESANVIRGPPFLFRYAEVVSRDHVVLESEVFISKNLCLKRAVAIKDRKLISYFAAYFPQDTRQSRINEYASLYGHTELLDGILGYLAFRMAGRGGHQCIMTKASIHSNIEGMFEEYLGYGHVTTEQEVGVLMGKISIENICIGLIASGQVRLFHQIRSDLVNLDHVSTSLIHQQVGQSGSIEMLKYVSQHIRLIDPHSLVLITAALIQGHLTFLEELHSLYQVNVWDPRIASSYGCHHPRTLEWFLNHTEWFSDGLIEDSLKFSTLLYHPSFLAYLRPI